MDVKRDEIDERIRFWGEVLRYMSSKEYFLLTSSLLNSLSSVLHVADLALCLKILQNEVKTIISSVGSTSEVLSNLIDAPK